MAISKDLPILIVDDYKTMLRIVRGLLQQLGFRNIEEATDGASALAMIKERPHSYGLIISDWNMQPVTGLDLLKQVRANAQTAELPFIMVTAEARTENVVAARQAGVNNYIIKPFTQAVLKQKISAVLGEF
ncbi:MAG: response regulator [Alphaproteobacteria bacterium]|nr:response regulator [Alphaproteobacteria bacterium]